MKALILLFLSGCAVSYMPPNQLSEQILTARPGAAVLSNRSMQHNGKAWIENIVTYDLNDPTIREAMFAMQFICSIGGKLYKVCEDRPGFCRTTYKGWFNEKKLVEYIPIKEKYDFLVQARTTCFSQLKREFDEIN